MRLKTKLYEEVDPDEVELVSEVLPVNKDFDPSQYLGKAKDFRVEDGKLKCELEIDDEKVEEKIKNGSLDGAPGGILEDHNFRIDTIGVTENE